MAEERCFGKASFKFLESSAAVVVELKGDVVLCKPRKGLGEYTEVADKSSVEITEPKEGLYALNCLRLCLVVDYSRLLRVHFNAVRADNKA